MKGNKKNYAVKAFRSTISEGNKLCGNQFLSSLIVRLANISKICYFLFVMFFFSFYSVTDEITDQSFFFFFHFSYHFLYNANNNSQCLDNSSMLYTVCGILRMALNVIFFGCL